MHSTRRISDIEVLRAAAVLLMILHHLRSLFPWKIPELGAFYGYLRGTFGVHLFFALSGFVITRDWYRG